MLSIQDGLLSGLKWVAIEIVGVKQLEIVSSSNFLRAGEFFLRRFMLKLPVMCTPSFGRQVKLFQIHLLIFKGFSTGRSVDHTKCHRFV